MFLNGFCFFFLSDFIIFSCVILDAKEAEDKQLLSVHSVKHVNQIKKISSKSFNSRNNIAARLNSIYFNEGSTEAAYLAAGSTIEVLFNYFLYRIDYNMNI